MHFLSEFCVRQPDVFERSESHCVSIHMMLYQIADVLLFVSRLQLEEEQRKAREESERLEELQRQRAAKVCR